MDTTILVISLVVLVLGVGLILYALTRMNARLSAPVPTDPALEAKLRELSIAHSELTGRLSQLTESQSKGQTDLQKTLSESLKSQAEQNAKTLGGLTERLTVIDQAQKNLTDLSGQVVGLQQILANKQTRGAYGQGHMEAIIRDALPPGAYQFQATLSNGKKPDCLIHLPDSNTAIVIDSKFPLECFELFRAATSDSEKKIAAARIRNDVQKHVKDIAEKYLIVGETQDPAIMFVPSESIYAELYDSFSEIIQQAHRVRVTVVSPNILMLAVNTVKTLLKDARMREQTSLIQKEVSSLLKDVGLLDDRVQKLQSHFGQADADIKNILISTGKIVSRAEKIEKVEVAVEQPKLPIA